MGVGRTRGDPKTLNHIPGLIAIQATGTAGVLFASMPGWWRVPGALKRPLCGVEHQVEALLHVLLALVERQLVHAVAKRVGDLRQAGARVRERRRLC